MARRGGRAGQVILAVGLLLAVCLGLGLLSAVLTATGLAPASPSRTGVSPTAVVGQPGSAPPGAPATATAPALPPTTAGPAGSTPVPTVGPAAAPSPTDVPATGLDRAVVVDVVDGDTIKVRFGHGAVETVRYIGVDTPETQDPRRPVQCFGQEASARNAELVGGQTVELERDVSERDRYGRLLRYVWVTGAGGGRRMVNQELVAGGFAAAVSYPPDVKHQDTLQAAEQAARAARRGLWGACPSFGAPAQPAATAPPAAGGGVAPITIDDCPASHPIKGNQGDSGWIYHLPGGRFYAATNPEECFATPADAEAAGYRRSRQ